MGDSEYVDQNICIMRHELQDNKIAVLERDLGSTNKKVDDCYSMFNDIKDLQTKTLYSIAGILVIVVLILFGVIVGRGVDFGLIFAGV